MRSEIVFRAQGNLPNRYQLCRTAARMMRLFHSVSVYPNDAITDALVHVAGSTNQWTTPLAGPLHKALPATECSLS